MKSFVAALLIGAALAAEAPPVTVDTVVTRTVKAMGGAEALRNLRNVRLAVEWTEAGRRFKGDYRATRDGRMRIDVFVEGKRVYSEGLDRRGAWEQPGEGAPVANVGAAARDALLHGISFRFDGIWFARESGHDLTYVGTDIVDGASYHVMRLKLTDGFQTYFYVNALSWLPDRRRDERAYHPSADPKKIMIETVQSDFSRRCGVQLPLASRDLNLATGETLSENRVTEALCNVDDAALELERPGGK